MKKQILSLVFLAATLICCNAQTKINVSYTANSSTVTPAATDTMFIKRTSDGTVQKIKLSQLSGVLSTSLTSTYIGFGSGSNQLSGSSNFTFTNSTNKALAITNTVTTAQSYATLNNGTVLSGIGLLGSSFVGNYGGTSVPAANLTYLSAGGLGDRSLFVAASNFYISTGLNSTDNALRFDNNSFSIGTNTDIHNPPLARDFEIVKSYNGGGVGIGLNNTNATGAENLCFGQSAGSADAYLQYSNASFGLSRLRKVLQVVNTQTASIQFFTKGSSDLIQPQMEITGTGNVGIGTTSTTPSATLDVRGSSGTTLKIVDGNQSAGYILKSDGSGNASWDVIRDASGVVSINNITRNMYDASGNVRFDYGNGFLYSADNTKAITISNDYLAASTVNPTFGGTGVSSTGTFNLFQSTSGGANEGSGIVFNGRRQTAFGPAPWSVAGVYGRLQTYSLGVYSGYLQFATSSSAGDLTEQMRIRANGVIHLSSTPAYADNAAALAGGLVAGDIYYTDTAGEYILKIAH